MKSANIVVQKFNVGKTKLYSSMLGSLDVSLSISLKEPSARPSAVLMLIGLQAPGTNTPPCLYCFIVILSQQRFTVTEYCSKPLVSTY